MPTSTPTPSLYASATTYPAVPQSISRVRADLRRILSGCRNADEMILCASELATNATMHSNSRKPGGTFTVRVQTCPGAHIRIEVRDGGGPWIDKPHDPIRSHGLDIVRVLADDSGITTTSHGRTVWACFGWQPRSLAGPGPQ